MNFDDTAEVVVSSMSVLGGQSSDIIQSAMDESDEEGDSSDDVRLACMIYYCVVHH